MNSGPLITAIDNAAAIEQVLLQRFWQLWNDSRQDGRLPGRDLVDPMKLRFILGQVTVFDVNPTPPRFVYRLLGQDIVDRIGVELTGKPLEAHPDPNRYAAIKAALEKMCDEGVAVRMYYPIALRDGSIPHEAILMPIADPAGRIIQALCGQVMPENAPRWRAGL
ncbi:PAS domain-containing protein [Ferrovibrio sp.]|uniref:PAS domain-containing protein n=1 Tax=Ferrovibrio sp. TaxID=1917215 RepID=UPI001B67C67E|nr:PAS domain-containing protein [Ferrovibrio sp.]MBP7066031.1 PAS domain-containing protein [Ferrovibrio sp.]